MKKRIWKRVVYAFAAALLLTGTASVFHRSGPNGQAGTEGAPDALETVQITEQDGTEAEVHFIDVGQGDATLIKCGGHAMLIDAGENDKGTAVQLYLQKQGVERLDYLVLTHPDSDHIGGADVIITKFPIDMVFMADYEKENQTYRDVLQALSDKGLKWSTPEVGAVYTLGAGKFTILAPNKSYNDPNNSSIALLFQNGDNSFLFTGDAEEEAEQDILQAALSVKTDVYKVGHHGSDTASCQEFLEAAAPAYAVISCGEGNSYGHPHAAVLNALRAMGVKVFRTDEQGSIIAASDGTEITWNCAPSDTWQTGERTGSSPQAQSSGAEERGKTVQSSEAEERGKTAQDGGAAQSGNLVQGSEAGASMQKQDNSSTPDTAQGMYIGNQNNGKLHRATCRKLPKEENRVLFDTKEEAVAAGYDDPCKLCNP